VSTAELAYLGILEIPLGPASSTFLPGKHLNSFSRRTYPPARFVDHKLLPIHPLNPVHPDIIISLLREQQSLSMVAPNQHEVTSSNVNTQPFPTPHYRSTHPFQGSMSDSAVVGNEHSPKPRVSFENDPYIGSTSRGAHPSMYPPPRNGPPSLIHLSCKPQGMQETPHAPPVLQSTQETLPGIIALQNLLGVTTPLVPEVQHLVR